MSAAPAVQIEGLSYRFGDHLAIDDLDLGVSPGECFGMLGPNTAGCSSPRAPCTRSR